MNGAKMGVLGVAGVAVVGSAALLFGGAGAGTASAQSGGDGSAYSIDAVHSNVLYRVMHLGTAYHYGRFDSFEGSFWLDPSDVENSRISVTVETESVNSGHEGRDKHLRNADFFDSKQFPRATFESRSVRRVDGDTVSVSGDLTLRGVTKPVTVEFDITGSGVHPRGGEIAGVHGEVEINRLDFGVDYLPDGLGREVKLILSFEGRR